MEALERASQEYGSATGPSRPVSAVGQAKGFGNDDRDPARDGHRRHRARRPESGARSSWKGDRIAAYGAREEVEVPNAAEIVDAPDATLIPGLIDLHVHLAFSGGIERDTFRTEVAGLNYAEMALRAAGYAHRTLRAGFTTLRDVHAPGGVVIDLARAIRAGHVPGPTIHACGTGLSVTGGHMDQPGWADHVGLEGVTCGLRRAARVPPRGPPAGQARRRPHQDQRLRELAPPPGPSLPPGDDR